MTDELPIQESVTLPVPEGPDADPGFSPAGRTALFAAAFILIPIVAVIASVAAVLLVRLLPFGGESADAATALTSTLIVELVLVGVIAALVRAFYRQGLLEAMGWSRAYSVSSRFLVLMGMGLAVSVMIVSTVFPPSDPPLQDLIDTPQAIAMFAVFGILFAPFLEELLFRGFYYRVLEDIAGTNFAVPATAVLFTLPHIPQLWGSWPAILLILTVGYVLSRLRRQTGSLIPPILVHTAYNSTLFFVAAISSLVPGAE